MDYRQLGRSGLRVSELCLGTMMFGNQTNEKDAIEIIAAAKDGGVNFIDSADVYNGGAAEQITGKAIKADRGDWVLCSKMGNATGTNPNSRGLSRHWVLEGTEACLKRLDTDYLDVLCLHREDRDVPLEETMLAVASLIRDGKVRYFGMSNFRPWRAAIVSQMCDDLGIDRPVMFQPQYNMLNRTAEYDLIPLALHYGIGLVPYSPLARGVLTGKYRAGQEPDPDSRAGRKDARMLATEWREESLAIAEKVAAYAATRKTNSVTLATQWVLANKSVSSVIAGPRTLQQWQGYVEALNYDYSAQDEETLSAMVPAGHDSTPGYIDPAYPVEGRVTR
ncbi:NADP-dependent oxidoreductase [Devosia epidermidihirudinis]|uniref:NADP-dependent oxidoreductase n=1 Tax=Devosia epidermidihirudinis TaxID=1293439 RepID=A0A0F5Q9G9_9HYPH|nr:aldo/keto reductase [Devosia epidermidihirudinis]KKC37413.1 NADP-dependent oxidoreductase [Devosia epidermidihirudinis]